VPRCFPAFDEVVQLRIDADAVIADQKARRDAGIFRDDPLDKRDDRVIRLGNAEDHLEFGIVDREAGAQRFLDRIFEPAHGPEDRNRGVRRQLGRDAPDGDAATQRHHEDADEVDARGDHSKRCREPDESRDDIGGHGLDRRQVRLAVCEARFISWLTSRQCRRAGRGPSAQRR